MIWNRFAELRTGAEFQQLPWSQNDGQLEINHFVLQGGVMLLESFALGTGALYKKNSIDNNQSEQILSSIITLGKKWADHTRTLFFTWPLLIPNYFL